MTTGGGCRQMRSRTKDEALKTLVEEAIREMLADELGYEPSEATVKAILKQVRGETMEF